MNERKLIITIISMHNSLNVIEEEMKEDT